MKLQNPFSINTRELFRDIQWICAECNGNGQNCGGVELNHIKGRCSNSPLNANVLCKKCHNEVGHSFEEESKYLKQTIKYLVRIDYKFNEADCGFFKENSKQYD